MAWFIFITFVVVVLIISTISIFTGEKPQAQREKERAEQLKAEEEKEIALAKQHREQYLQLYGPLTKEISYRRWQNDVPKYIYIFEDSSTLVANDIAIKFKDIVDFTVTDDGETKLIGSTATTKTDTGSMLGRTVAGGLLGGGIGAAIGGATASKTTTYSDQETETEHIYTVNITVNNLSNPLVAIDLSFDWDEVINEIVAILSIIVKRNREQAK